MTAPRRLPAGGPTVGIWYTIAISFVTVVAVSLGGIAYTNHVQRVADQRWCSLLINLTETQRRNPPQTESGRNFARELQRLRDSFNCPPE